MSRAKYTDEEFITAWQSSRSIRECLQKLDVVPAGGNYSIAKNKANKLGLTRDHMLGQGWSRGTKEPRPSSRMPLEQILVLGSTYQSNNLRKRLIKENVLEEKCSAPFCPFKDKKFILDPFTNKKISLKLELDHINGVKTDNRLHNLRLLCSHCHSYTETFRGLNMESCRLRPCDETGKHEALKKL